MIDISEEEKNNYKSDIGNKQIRLEFYRYDTDISPTYVLENENIISESMELNEALSTESNIRYGQCFSNRFSIDIFNLKQTLGSDIDFIGYKLKAFIYTNNNIRLYPRMGIYPGMGTSNNIYPNMPLYKLDEIPLFVGYITDSKLSDNRNNRKITAYDILNKKLNTDITELFWNDLIKGKTAKYIREKILSYLDIPYENVSLSNDNLEFLEAYFKDNTNFKINARQALESILEICGCFGHINRYGIFTFKTLIKTYYNYPALSTDERVKYPTSNLYLGNQREAIEIFSEEFKTYINCRYGESKTKSITGISFIKNNNYIVDAIYPNTENVYISKGNCYLEYFMEGETFSSYISSNLYQQISNIIYMPVSLQCVGLPYLEVGDYVLVYLNNDDAKFLTFPILSRHLKGIQSLKDTLEAKGNKYRK